MTLTITPKPTPHGVAAPRGICPDCGARHTWAHAETWTIGSSSTHHLVRGIRCTACPRGIVPAPPLPPPYLADLPAPAEMDTEWDWARDLGACLALAMYLTPDCTPIYAIGHTEAPTVALALTRALGCVMSEALDALDDGCDLGAIRARRDTLMMWIEEALRP